MRRYVAKVETRAAPIGDPARPVRVAILGAGKAARFHLDALDLMEGVVVAGICSRSGTSAEELVGGRPGVVTTTDPDDLMDRVVPDAVIVAVAHDQTAAVTRRVLERRLPVLVEKPAASTSAEVTELAELAEATGTLAVAGVNRRYYSLVTTALWTIRQRGPVRGVLVEGHEPTDLLSSWGAVEVELLRRWFLLDAVHYVDLLRLAGGSVRHVDSAVGSGHVAPGEHLSASLSFEDGAVGTFVSHWNSAAPQMMKIFGDHATAEVRLSPPERAFVEFTGGRRIELEPDPIDALAKPGVHAQDAAFLMAVASGGRPPAPASDLYDHAATLRLIEEMLGSAG